MIAAGAFLINTEKSQSVYADIIYNTGGDTITGAGTEQSPYLIGSAVALRSVSTWATGNRYYKLTSHIDFTGTANWSPVAMFPVGSVFDGDGYEINGMTISGTTGNLGMFAEFRGTMKNVTFTNVSISSSGSAVVCKGVVAGRITGGTANNTTNGLVFTSLIENVRVESGSITNSSTGSVFTGSLVGSITGFGKSINDPFYVVIKNSYSRINITGRYTTGGLIGCIGGADSAGAGYNATSNSNVAITNCYYWGVLTSTGGATASYTNIDARESVGGIVGRAFYLSQGGATNNKNVITITNCYARGDFKTNLTTTYAYAGGIVGVCVPSTDWNRYLTISNCFVMAQIRDAGLRGAIVGGQDKSNTVSSSVFSITNCHYSKDLFPDGDGNKFIGTVLGSGITLSTSRTTADMKTSSFIDAINRKGTPEATHTFRRTLAGEPELTIFDNVVILTFDANGGSFEAPSQLPENMIFENDKITMLLEMGGKLNDEFDDVKGSNKIGYDFDGWSLVVNGAVDYADIAALPQIIDYDIHLYAKWIPIQFNVVTTGQELEARNENDSQIYGISIFQQGGHLRVNTFGYSNFIGIYVLKNTEYGNESDAASWAPLGKGDYKEGGIWHLDFYDTNTGEYLINEDFVTDYGYKDGSNWSFTFRAVLSNNTPLVAKVVSNDNTFGRLVIDGVSKNSGVVMEYEDPGIGSIVMTVQAFTSKYRDFEDIQFMISTDGTNFKDYNDSSVTSYVNASPVPIKDDDIVIGYQIKINVPNPANPNFTVRAMFKNKDYKISVVGEAVTMTTEEHGGQLIEVPVTLPVIGGIEKDYFELVNLNSGCTYTNKIESVEGFRLTSNSVNNIKILNQQKKLKNEDPDWYDYFPAPNGRIEFGDGESSVERFSNDFFDKYLDENNEIIIIAMYTQQFQLKLDFTFNNGTENIYDYETLRDKDLIYINIKNPDRTTHRPFYDDLGWYDVGAEVEIRITSKMGTTITDIEENGASLGTTTGTLLFTLAEDREITITFGVVAYSTTLRAENLDGEELPATFTRGTATVNAGDLIGFDFDAFVNITSSLENYVLTGWYAEKMTSSGTELWEITKSDALTDELIMRERVTLETTCMQNNVLKLVAVYTRKMVMEVKVTGDAGGKVSVYIVDKDGNRLSTLREDEYSYKSDPLPADSFVEIVFLPIAFYEVSQDTIDRIEAFGATFNKSGNYARISMSSFREIPITYVPQKYDIDLKVNVSNGKVTLDSTQISLDETLRISFKANMAFQASGWKINGKKVSQINSATKTGDTVLLTADSAWLATFISEENGRKLEITVDTQISTVYVLGLLLAAIIIPVFVVIALLLIRLNQKRKAELLRLQALQEQNKKRMEFNEQMKSIQDLTGGK